MVKKGSKKCPVCGKLFALKGLTNHIKAHNKERLARTITLNSSQGPFDQSMTVTEPTDPPLTEEEFAKLSDKVLTLERENNFLRRRINRYQTALSDLTELLDLTISNPE